jgi:hypothetical protein
MRLHQKRTRNASKANFLFQSDRSSPMNINRVAYGIPIVIYFMDLGNLNQKSKDFDFARLRA